MKTLDSEHWVNANFRDCQLGDARRTKRLVKVASKMLAAPEQSVPQQSGQSADLKAAYHFFANDNVTFGNVSPSQWYQTRRTKPGPHQRQILSQAVG